MFLAKPIRAGHAPVPQGIRGGQQPQKIINDDSLKRKSMKGNFLLNINQLITLTNFFVLLELEQSWII